MVNVKMCVTLSFTTLYSFILIHFADAGRPFREWWKCHWRTGPCGRRFRRCLNSRCGVLGCLGSGWCWGMGGELVEPLFDVIRDLDQIWIKRAVFNHRPVFHQASWSVKETGWNWESCHLNLFPGVQRFGRNHLLWDANNLVQLSPKLIL